MTLKVASDSMSPLIITGDNIRVEPFRNDRKPRIGEIVLLRTHGGWLVHRIVGRTGAGETTLFMQKGDAGHHAHLVSSEAITGRVVSIERDGASIDLDAWHRQAVSTAVGRFFQLIDWMVSRGSDLGRDHEDGTANPSRVVISGMIRKLERCVSWIGTRLVRGSRR
jgi:hypothetical protein